jgi:hypothetical protein
MISMACNGKSVQVEPCRHMLAASPPELGSGDSMRAEIAADAGRNSYTDAGRNSCDDATARSCQDSLSRAAVGRCQVSWRRSR